jgi:hypothetical protein
VLLSISPSEFEGSSFCFILENYAVFVSCHDKLLTNFMKINQLLHKLKYWTEKHLQRKSTSIKSLLTLNTISTPTKAQYNINTNKRTIVLWCVIITRCSATCFGHLCGHVQGGTNCNYNFILAYTFRMMTT